MTITPTRQSDPQQLVALREANRVRSARATTKRRIRRDPEQATGIVRVPPLELATMRIRDVLLAIPMLGPSKTDRFLVAAQINSRRTLAGLTDRQRDEAVQFITAHIQGRP